MANKRKFYTSRWTEQETFLLIDCRIKEETSFKKKNVLPKELWTKISEEINISKDGGECLKKWKNLVQKYKELKEPKTGRGMTANKLTSKNWVFYPKLNDHLGGRHTIAPVTLLQTIHDELQYEHVEYLAVFDNETIHETELTKSSTKNIATTSNTMKSGCKGKAKISKNNDHFLEYLKERDEKVLKEIKKK